MCRLMTGDLGSFNLKFNSGGIYENRFLIDNERDIFGLDTLEFEGNTYFFGQGHFNMEGLKTNKDILVPLLFGLGKEGVAGNINIILHLPLKEMSRKSIVVELLQGKTFQFKINGNANSITFDKVGVLKEGFSSFYSLPKRNEGLIAMIDIGGRTTDVFTFVDGKQEKEDSISIGTMNYFDKIATKLIGMGQNRNMEEIHKLITKNIIDLKDFEDVTEKVFNEMINELLLKFPHLNDYSIKLCGGGAEYFEKQFKNKFRKVNILSNNMTSNVDGAEKIGKAKGLDK